MVEIITVYRASCTNCGVTKTMENHQIIVGWAEQHNCKPGVKHTNVFDEAGKNDAAMDPREKYKTDRVLHSPEGRAYRELPLGGMIYLDED